MFRPPYTRRRNNNVTPPRKALHAACVFALAVGVGFGFTPTANAHPYTAVAHNARHCHPTGTCHTHYHRCGPARTHCHRHVHSHTWQPTRQQNLIRACESGARDRNGNGIAGTYNYSAQNPTSTASGGWSFLDSTWGNHRGYRKARYAPRSVQDEKFRRHYAQNGATPWNASRSCWT